MISIFIIIISGLQITLEAYSDVVERIFKVVNEVVFNSTISENLFREIVEITYNDLKMKENSAPYLKGFMIFNKIIIQNNTDYSENLNVNILIYSVFEINRIR
jgi:secreted Zn-dependent insulinase-like peptidase